jgi:hypothetical protein
LAAKFDLIYPLETRILGYEYGGDPSNTETYGGKDGDPKIQILVYDFYGDSGGLGSTGGFFWSKDFYYGVNSQSWYNEMLSMAAEDMVSPLIGIGPTNNSHPISQRISNFLTSYANEGVNTWNGSGNTLESYSYKYTFGAYLARNYGGVELVKNILANESTNEASVVAALRQTTGNTSIDFNYAVEKFAEAFIFSNPKDGRATFNQTVTKTISGTTYTFTGFDIWNARYTLTGGSYHNWGGPTIYPLANQPTMQPNSVYVQSLSADWKTGTLSSVMLNKPAAAGVKLYLMVR